MSRVYNFSAGPAVLPEAVLKEAAAEMAYAADTPEAMRAMPQHVVMTLLCGERTY